VEIEIRPEPTADERAALLAALASATERQTDPYRSVWRLAGVLENVESGTAWTHAELLDSVRRWATTLAANGVRPGDHVATMLLDQADGMRTWLGSAFAGAVEAPLNPQHRGELLRAALERVAPRVLVIDPAVLDELDADDLAGAGTVLTTESPLAGAALLEPPALRDADPAAVIFTSGTTGPSKAAVVPWATMYQMVSWAPADAFGPGDGLFCPLPMFHVAGKSGFTNALARRARYVYRPTFSASSFIDDVRATGCTVASVVGPMLSILHATTPRADDAVGPLRAVLCGPMIPEIEDFEHRFGVRVATCYGMTEIGAVLTTGYEHGPWNTCGRVRRDFPWPEVRIVDGDGRDVEPGEVGELVARTPYPAAFSPGYLDDAEATSAAWRDGWFRTGDAFRVDDEGNHYLVDRYKDAIRRRGENVSSYEVESVIASHPAVAECAAVGAPGAHGDDDIVVFVLPSAPGAVDTDELTAWATERLPSHMRPVAYRVMDELPRNATTMRVKKYELRRLVAED